MNQRISDKLKILADAAKYDVSCASSGGKRENKNKGLGNSHGMGICHSYTEDGRCVSLLKILFTNYCIYDCAYCVSRKSNDIERAAFSVKEVVDLTINFYRRNYIEGLFLSSGIFKNADYTNEKLVKVAEELRAQNFNGYIHLKIIPGASQEVIQRAAQHADRLSVNMELPTERSLKQIAPEKNHTEVLQPMGIIKDTLLQNKEDLKKFKHTPKLAAGGQSTQFVIGATSENDYEILNISTKLYDEQRLKRVYYSGYVPISTDTRISAEKSVPMIRENRLYQADWLMRFYEFEANEIVDDSNPFLDLQIDPKLSYALRNYDLFPIDPNTASYELILRVPGIGVKSAKMIVQARRHSTVRLEHLRKMGVALNRAKYFLNIKEGSESVVQLNKYDPHLIRELLVPKKKLNNQLSLF